MSIASSINEARQIVTLMLGSLGDDGDDGVPFHEAMDLIDASPSLPDLAMALAVQTTLLHEWWTHEVEESPDRETVVGGWRDFLIDAATTDEILGRLPNSGEPA